MPNPSPMINIFQLPKSKHSYLYRYSLFHFSMMNLEWGENAVRALSCKIIISSR